MRSYKLQRPASAIHIDYEKELNAQQLEAVTAPPGPALVLAGAGSGKTRALTYRVAYLLENGIDPSNILLLTFTNKAAREMLHRVGDLLPHDVSQLWGGTFHAIGHRILRRHAERLGFSQSFTILDRDDQASLLDAAMDDAGVSHDLAGFPKATVLAELISYSINTATPLATIVARKHDSFVEWVPLFENIWEAYEIRKKKTSAVDFDDLLSKTLELLSSHPDLGERYRNQFQFILVDEYQDTNVIQADLIDFLAGRDGNLTVVGDDAQSIYSWRGANHRNIMDFPKRHPSARIYKIETNYRSVPAILQVANASIRANTSQFQKNLQPSRREGPVQPALLELATSAQQAAFVAQRVSELLSEGRDLKDMAILYRSHFHSMEIQLELTRRGIPFTITSGIRFFEQAHTKDVAAFLRFAVNPSDEIAFKRIAKLLPGIGGRHSQSLWEAAQPLLVERPTERPLGETLAALKPPRKSMAAWQQLLHTLDELSPAPDKNPPPQEMIRCVRDAIYDAYLETHFPDSDTRADDLTQLQAFAAQFTETNDFLAQLSLLAGVDGEPAAGYATPRDALSLSTIHQAKGLEWKVVFLVWLADGMFPSARALESADSIEEERRLFYVAVTRAMDELYLSYPLIKTQPGAGDRLQRKSLFLRELPPNLLEEWKVEGPGMMPW